MNRSISTVRKHNRREPGPYLLQGPHSTLPKTTLDILIDTTKRWVAMFTRNSEKPLGSKNKPRATAAMIERLGP
jgi:hypothetical protein